MYKCAAIGLQTCCSVDACQLGGCPIDAQPASTLGQSWGLITSTSLAATNPTTTPGIDVISIPSLEAIESQTTRTKWVTVPSTTLTAWVTATEPSHPAATDAVEGAAPIPPSQPASPTPLTISNGAKSLQPGVVAGISVGLAIGVILFAVLTCILYCGRSEDEHGKGEPLKDLRDAKAYKDSEKPSFVSNVWPQMSPRPKMHRETTEYAKSKRLMKNNPKIVVERILLEDIERPLSGAALAGEFETQYRGVPIAS